MKIAFCDDDPIIHDIFKEMFYSQFDISIYNYVIYDFTDGNKLLESNDEFDIYILDVDMPRIGGFQVASQIRQKFQDACIIFLTSHREKMQQAFKVRAFRYLIKPIDINEFKEAILAAINEIINAEKILITSNDNEIVLQIDKIIYIECIGDSCAIHTLDNYILCRKSLKEWRGILDGKSFYQTHKSYIVNLKHIVKYDNKLIMDNNDCVPLSRRNISNFKKAFHEYISINAL